MKTETDEAPPRRCVPRQDPATGEHLGDFDVYTAADVEAAVARARAAAPGWAATPIAQRLKALRRVCTVIRDEGAGFAARISRDCGKPVVDSLMTELAVIPLFFDYYADIAPKALAPRSVRMPLVLQPRRAWVETVPLGVIAVIAPWNFPLNLAVVPALSALISGNTVVLKPSEVTPLVSRLIEEIFSRAALPRGVVEVVHGDGSTGAALCAADVDKIFFTGSVATGRRVMEAAAKKPIPVELELGGKDPFIVCADADLERAARACAWGGLINAGQMCISVERIFVVEAVHDRFVALLRREVDAITVGGPDDDADMGPLTFEKQIDVVERHVADAIERGATVVCGGRRLDRPGRFYAPTLVTGVTPTMEIYREETFGPVLPVIRVRDEATAIAMANDHRYALNASIWSRDTKRARRLASQIDAGQVSINDVVVSVGNPTLPFGGMRASGFGRYHGPEGLHAFTTTRAVQVSMSPFASEPFWFPYAGKRQAMTRLFHQVLDRDWIGAVRTQLELVKLSRREKK
jgi:acyl-CoA reductase-like NAD-dependent aldehyde dehydrogenase